MGETVTIKKVRLHNFLSHQETILEFDRGVTVFVGPNGAGKSSILEAIYFALTGKGWRTRGNEKKPLIRAGANDAVVELWLRVGNDELHIRRTISRKGRSGTEVRFRGELIRSEDDANRRIREILGLGHDALRVVGILPQGGITALFLEYGPAERKSMIDKLLGLDAYEEAGKHLGEYVIEPETSVLTTFPIQPTRTSLSRFREHVRKQAALISSKKAELDTKKLKIKELETELEKAKERSKELQTRIDSLKTELENLAQLEVRKAKTEGEAAKLSERLELIRKKKSELKARLREIEKSLTNAETIKAMAELLDTAKELKQARNEFRETEEKLEREEERLKGIQENLEKLRSLMRKYPGGPDAVKASLEKLETDLDGVKKELNKVEIRVARLETEIENLRNEVSKAETKVSEFVKNASSVLGKSLSDVNEVIDELLRWHNELKEKLEARRNELADKEAKYNTFLERARAAKEKLEILMTGEAGGKCPLCGTKLDEQHMRQVEEKLRAELSEAQEHAEKLRALIKGLKEELSSLEKAFDSVSNLVKSIDEIRSLIDEWTRKRAELKEKLREAKEARDRKSNLEPTVDELKKRIEELRGAYSEALMIPQLMKTVSEEDYNRQLEEVKNLRAKLKELREKIAGMEVKLGKVFDLSAGIDKIIRAAEEAKVKAQKLSELQGTAATIKEQLNELTAEEKEVDDTLKKMKKELSALKTELKRKEEIEKQVKELEDELAKVNKSVSETEGRINALRDSVSELTREIGLMQEDLRKLIDAWFKAEVLRWVKEKVLHKDGAPRLLRTVYIRCAEETVRDLLERFNLEYSDVTIDEDFNILLKSPSTGGEGIDIARLSGGERVAASLIALLALHKIISKGRLGFLILDEPTIHLDTERRRRLIDVLKEFKGGEVIQQLIIVTHDEEVKEAADTVYEVSRVERYSKVREVELYE